METDNGQIQNMQMSLCDMLDNLAFQEVLEMDNGWL